MLETLYNDPYLQLSFIHNVNKETLLVVDDDLYVYESISYNPFEPSNEDIAQVWEKTTTKYLRIGTEDNLTAWRESQKAQSDKLFREWLKNH